MVEELKQELINSLEECIKAFETTGALPSPIMERDYGMLRSLQTDSENQKYISFMSTNYYSYRFGKR